MFLCKRERKTLTLGYRSNAYARRKRYVRCSAGEELIRRVEDILQGGKEGEMRPGVLVHRHDISGEARKRIKELLPGQAGKRGGVAKDERLVERYAARIRKPEQHA